MNNKLITLTSIIILTTVFTLFCSFKIKEDIIPNFKLENDLIAEAFKVLESKCNVCHRKQNPFMVFKLKNMEKRAVKIHRMVFLERRMPKGNDIHLTKKEYSTLKKWLSTQNI